jgi:hypothetical protein
MAELAGMTPSALADWLSAQVEATRPAWARGPGEIRLLMAHGEQPSTRSTLESFAETSTLKPTLAEHSHGDFVICQELQNVPFGQLVYSLLEGRADALEFIARLHTRSDIHWTGIHEQFQMC